MKDEKGKSHPIFETMQRLRDAYLGMGFTEVINPLFIEDTDVYKQFGPEAPIILDRCYFLAGLPRPDIGLSDEKLKQVREPFVPDLDRTKIEDFKKVLRGYKTGEMDADDLVENVASALKISGEKATLMLDTLFPEFKSMKPQPTNITLRSHMTASWFITLTEVQHKFPLPVKLFSADRVFRREQKEDMRHVRSHHSASCVVMEEDVSVDTGKEVAIGLLGYFGFKNFIFTKKKVASRYYKPDSEVEVFIETGQGDQIEVADFGIYNPASLERYGIEHPVMNLGLGVERLAMLLYKESDLRRLLYPWKEWTLSDKEIASLIRIDLVPATGEGEAIKRGIAETIEKNASAQSPCEFLAWRGTVRGKSVSIYVFEKEEKAKLCGPAYRNEFVVHDGNILAVPEDKKWEEVLTKGVRTGIRFVDAIASLAAHEIEKAAAEGKNWSGRVKMSRSPADVNVRVDDVAVRYVTSQKKKIDARGPVFVAVRMEIEERVEL
jgi:O-phosphoseryl-tRNA synthetase